MQALFGDGFALPEIVLPSAGYPQPERRIYVYFQQLAQAFEAPPRKSLWRRTPAPDGKERQGAGMAYARPFTRRTEKGKHYGVLTPKFLDVLEALLWGFHNAHSGLCFPSLAKIAEAAKCAPSTVAEALKALEATGVLSWVNRIARIRERCEDLFGNLGTRWRIIRTSNAYHFHDPKGAGSQAFPSKSEFPSGTSTSAPCPAPLDPDNDLDAALIALKERTCERVPLDWASRRLRRAYRLGGSHV
jgi:Helix-turn-helix domain